MKRLFGWGKLGEQEQACLESRLAEALSAVTPRPEYAQGLRRRLLSYPGPVPTEPEESLSGTKVPRYIVLAVASFLSGTFLIVIGVRAIVALVNTLQTVRRQVNSTSSPRPAI